MVQTQTVTPTTLIERAKVQDARGISRLVEQYARQRLMLPRSLSQVFAAIRDFRVARVEGELAGCVALHIDDENLAEVRSLAVDKRFTSLGLGRRLVASAIQDARNLGIKRVYALTYIVPFFERLDFQVIDKSELPHKVWADCVNCCFFPNCNETAMIRDVGEATTE